MSSEASRANRAFYDSDRPGKEDYWRKMAAPLFRVRTLLQYLALDRPSTVVDLGCGNGAMIDRIATTLPGARMAGIDVSREQIMANQKRLPDVNWHISDLDGPAAPPASLDSSCDAVIAMEVIEHLDHPHHFLESALRLATPGRGRLFLSTQSGRMGETERQVGHRRHYSATDMRQLLEASGWKVRELWNSGYPFHDLSKWVANLNPEASMNRFSGQAYGPRENLACAALRLAFRLNSKTRGAQLFAVAERPPT